MNDETLEAQLKKIPTPELPEAWRAEILLAARRQARASGQPARVFPPVQLYLRNLCVRNPVTSGALAALWLVIFFFKAGTPNGVSERITMAHLDPLRPVHLISLEEEIRLAESWQDPSDERQREQIP